MAEFIPVNSFEIVIFGGTGDLSKRKLLPALFHRFMDGQIPADSKIIATARSEATREEFHDIAKNACLAATDKDSWSEDMWSSFAKLLDYVTLDVKEGAKAWTQLRKKLRYESGPTIYYLATSPSLYVDICQAMAKADMAKENCRIVLEKPIGRNLETARIINDGVCSVFDESQIFRIDHYLGKETVQNLMVLRFANALFEPVWSHNQIEHIQITVSEDLGLEGRAGYYDRSGALRDMVQNHLLQLLCLIAMEPPNSMEGDDIRTEKIKVLRALQPFDLESAKKQTVRGQYTKGVVKGEPVNGYLDELDGESSNTETFVAIKTKINNWRWANVPIYLRTGKRMSRRNSEIVIQFKQVAHSIFGEADNNAANKMVIKLQPDEAVRLYLDMKEPGPGGLRIKSLPLNLSYAENFQVRYPDAYERLLMDVVRGNLALFMRRDEVESAWEWVDGLIRAWDQLEQPVEDYAAGTDGPLGSAMLLDRDGFEWRKSTSKDN